MAEKQKDEEKPLIPMPILELIRQTDKHFSSKWFNDFSPLFAKLLEWSLMFFIGYFGFGYGWILFFATVHFAKFRESAETITDTLVAKMSTVTSEKNVLGSSLDHFPAWVAFPDFDRPEWINDIIAQIWPSLDGYATHFVVDFIVPEIKKILDSMALDTVSGFKVTKIAVGTVPARLGGIKVYKRNTNRDEIVLDAEVIYSGDARVQFTLQKIRAEVNQINLRGMVRITLKPILNTFPFIGGFEFYFLNKPQLDYSFGGIGHFAAVPGANAIVKSVVEDQIRSRFVWPNKFHMYLPLDLIKTLPEKNFLLAKPAGLLCVNLKEAKDLMKKDKGLIGSGTSDPYAIVTIGERKVSFRDRYVAKDVNPTWDYYTEFIMEDSFGQDVCVEVFDFDNSTADDFLGRCSFGVSHIASSDVPVDKWIELDDAKHGEIRTICKWQETEVVEDADPASLKKYDAFVVSLYVDSSANVGKERKSSLPSPKCKVHFTRGEERSTQVKNKTKDPVFEESFTFLCKDIDMDTLTLEVVDTKGSDLLGKVRIPVSYVAKCPKRQFFDMVWNLEDAVNENATVTLSAKLYGIKRDCA